MILEVGGSEEGGFWETENFKVEWSMTLRCLVAFLRHESNDGLMVLRITIEQQSKLST